MCVVRSGIIKLPKITPRHLHLRCIHYYGIVVVILVKTMPFVKTVIPKIHHGIHGAMMMRVHNNDFCLIIGGLWGSYPEDTGSIPGQGIISL